MFEGYKLKGCSGAGEQSVNCQCRLHTEMTEHPCYFRGRHAAQTLIKTNNSLRIEKETQLQNYLLQSMNHPAVSNYTATSKQRQSLTATPCVATHTVQHAMPPNNAPLSKHKS